VIGLLVVPALLVLIGFILVTMTRLRELNVIKGILVAGMSIAIGFLLMFPLGALFNAMNWPWFHSWALIHGSLVIAWPILSVVGFLSLRVLGVIRKSAAKRGKTLAN
jgi:hypothetical protein